MLQRIGSYKEFCDLAKRDMIVAEMRSEQGKKAITTLRNAGWDISFVKPEKDILKKCLDSTQNFDFAYREAEVSFWAKAEISSQQAASNAGD